MDKCFFNIFFGLIEEKVIVLLEVFLEELEDKLDCYIVVSYLVNFFSECFINVLIKII